MSQIATLLEFKYFHLQIAECVWRNIVDFRRKIVAFVTLYTDALKNML